MGYEEISTLVVIVVAAGAGITYAYRQLRRQHRRRSLGGRLRQHRPTGISGCQEGLVMVEGRARSLDTVTAPVIGSEVIGYSLKVGQVGSEANFHSRYETLIDTCKVVGFEIEDESGRLHVDPGGAQLLFEPAFKTVHRGLEEITDQMREILREAFDWHRDFETATYRWTVSTIEPGQRIWAFGAVHPTGQAAGEGGAYRSAGPAISLVRPEDWPLYIADRPREDLSRALRGADLPWAIDVLLRKG